MEIIFKNKWFIPSIIIIFVLSLLIVSSIVLFSYKDAFKRTVTKQSADEVLDFINTVDLVYSNYAKFKKKPKLTQVEEHFCSN